MAQAPHLSVAGRRVVLIPDQVKGAMCRKERNFLPEGPAMAFRLPSRLLRRQDDIAKLERPVYATLEASCHRGATHARRQGRTERQDIGDAVVPAMARVEVADLILAHERQRELGIGTEPRVGQGDSDGTARETDVRRSCADDAEAQGAKTACRCEWRAA